MVTISDWAFSECRKLSRITIPDSVHDIGEGAFSNCALLVVVYCREGSAAENYCRRNGIRFTPLSEGEGLAY